MGDPRIEAIAEWLIEGARSEDVLAEIHALRRNAANLLDFYVGQRSGERILAGHIERGDCEELDAAIWLSDMRASPPSPTICRRRHCSRCGGALSPLGEFSLAGLSRPQTVFGSADEESV
jgi:hypothetical protein